uniref:Uncharacterized protein n=1 Tax=Siphoviridae sp. ctWhx86 TaxID=2826362 RepID=A0A8S5QPX1_9CAUD|nr:MAG TPA: hypothetical protein [Siphoviridae sp. ctWhx86]
MFLLLVSHFFVSLKLLIIFATNLNFLMLPQHAFFPHLSNLSNFLQFSLL